MAATNARPGFHLYYRPVRFTTTDRTPGQRHTPERCTCTFNGNHATERTA